ASAEGLAEGGGVGRRATLPHGGGYAPGRGHRPPVGEHRLARPGRSRAGRLPEDQGGDREATELEADRNPLRGRSGRAAPGRGVIRRSQEVIADWLKGMGLELKPSKTFLSHTRAETAGRRGFDFLGFTVRQFRVGKHHSGKSGGGRELGFKTLIK